MGLLSSIGKGITKSLDTLSAAFIKPVETAKAIISPTKKVSDVIAEVNKQSLSKNISATILNTATAAATIAGGAAIATAAKAGTLKAATVTVAKSLIPTTTKGKVVAAVAAPIVVGAVVREPVKTATTLAKAPSELAQFGGDIATLAANPSLENVKELVKESPVLTAATGLIVAGGAIKTLAPAIATARQTEAIQEQTEAIKAAVPSTPSIIYPKENVSDKVISPVASTTPQVAETKQVNAKPLTKRKKRSKKSVMPSVKQNVNVIVNNKAVSTGIRQTKRYLNREVLFN